MNPFPLRHLWLRRAAAWLLAAAAAALVIDAAVPARACSTPVCRYAMYNWPTAPYYVFYIHHGQPAPEDEAVHKAIEEMSTAEAAPANVVLERIDGGDQEALKRLPEVVQEAWAEADDGSSPVHLVYTAWGAKLFSGRLDKKTLDAMVHSPARKKLAELLHEGNMAVMLVLPGSDAKANAAAEKAVAKIVADAAAGKFSTDAGLYGDYLPEQPAAENLKQEQGSSAQQDTDQPGDAAPTGQDDAAGQPGDATETQDSDAADAGDSDDGAEPEAAEDPNQIRLASLTVSRSDLAEKWLVEALMAIEPDLDEYAKEPMVFAVYGRGRAMPPYLGEGITADNLADVAFFLAGPCSCMVKGQNPGMDLLMAWDWDATAEAWAATDPAMSADPWGYGYYEEYPVDTPTTDETPAAAEPAGDAPSGGPGGDASGQPSDPAAAVASAENTAETDEGAGGGAARAATASEPSDAPDDAAAVAAQPDEAAPGAAAEAETAAADASGISSEEALGFGANLKWIIGLGAVGATLAVVVAGFALMRLQRPG